MALSVAWGIPGPTTGVTLAVVAGVLSVCAARTTSKNEQVVLSSVAALAHVRGRGSPVVCWSAGHVATALTLFSALVVIARRPRLPRSWAVRWLAAGTGVGAVVAWLAQVGVTLLEAYTLTIGVAAIISGAVVRRSHPGTSSWIAYGPGMMVLLEPCSLVVVLGSTGPMLRSCWVVAVSVAAVAIGAEAALKAPLVLGTVALVVLAIDALRPAAVDVPKWIPIGVAGASLHLVDRRDLRASHDHASAAQFGLSPSELIAHASREVAQGSQGAGNGVVGGRRCGDRLQRLRRNRPTQRRNWNDHHLDHSDKPVRRAPSTTAAPIVTASASTSERPATTPRPRTTVESTVAWSDEIAATGESLGQTLPTVDDYRSLPWGAPRTSEFLTGPFGPGDVSETVQAFGVSDIERDGLDIGRIELAQLIDDFSDTPPDDAVLDTVSGYTYTPGATKRPGDEWCLRRNGPHPAHTDAGGVDLVRQRHHLQRRVRHSDSRRRG